MYIINRFLQKSKPLFGAICLLALSNVNYSCSDDYDLDETKPEFLGSSIYEELKSRGNFTTMIRLIDDLDLTDVMSKTGSNTLFVAPDSAFDTFFKTTNWKTGVSGQRVQSYEDLSNAQKRWLLKGAMLSNANVLEMLTTLSNSNDPIKNVCLRQESSLQLTDTIPFLKWNELPQNLNEGTLDSEGNVTNKDVHFWDAYRDQSRGGIYLALDNTKPLMTHFLESQLKEKSITHEDVSFILNLDKRGEKPWSNSDTQNRSFIYDAEILEQDVTCQNGYFNVLNKVLVTPPNMAEMIRQNPKTQLFSSMLERFSAPYYDASLTKEYKSLYDISQDSVYTKYYFASRGSDGDITKTPDGQTLPSLYSENKLDFDPGWNSYNASNLTKEQDMAIMFVPNDDAVAEYFINGDGRTQFEQYVDEDKNDLEHLQENLYKLPLNVIKPLVKNLMKESFNETVPSKYLTIMNDSKDQMFSPSKAQYRDIEAYKANIDTVMLANNGVVYVTKTFPSPAEYISVMAPVTSNKGTRVFNAVLHADDSYVNTNYTNAPLRKYYSTYLLAMQSKFTLFVPVDAGLKSWGYYDPLNNPMQATSGIKYYYFWTLEPEEGEVTGKRVSIKGVQYRVRNQEDIFNSSAVTNKNDQHESAATGASGNMDGSNIYGSRKKQILIDMVDQHIIVHDDDEANGIDGTKSFYVSRGNAPVYVAGAATGDNNLGLKVQGGFQLYRSADQEEDAFNNFSCTVEKSYNQSVEGNGYTYFLDRPMQPSVYTVYELLNANSNYSEFADLCDSFSADNSQVMDLLEEVFRKDEKGEIISTYKNDSKWYPIRNKYCIYAANDNSTGHRYTYANSKLVRFFNNYRYTIFAPSNAAMEKAYEANLPRVSDIMAEVFKLDDEGNIMTDADDNPLTNEYDKTKVRAEIECLVNFLRYHFCDESFFVEKSSYSDGGTEAQSACIPDEVYQTFNVKHDGGQIKLTDVANRQVTTATDYKNILARDYEFSAEFSSTSATTSSISASSYVTINGLNDYMLFDKSLLNGGSPDFSKAWATTSSARAFVKKYSHKL